MPQIEVSLEGKFITLTKPGHPEHLCRQVDHEGIAAAVLELAAKPKEKEAEVAGNGKDPSPPEGSSESVEGPDLGFIGAVQDVLSVPGVAEGVKSIGDFLGAISTPRKEGQ